MKQDNLIEFVNDKDFIETVLNTASSAIAVINLEGKFIYLNGSALKLYGYSKDELIGQPFTTLFSPKQDTKELQKLFQKVISSRKTYSGEIEEQTKSGDLLTIKYKARALYLKNKLVGIVASSEDITQRLITEKQLKESEERFRILANTAPVLIWMSDTSKQINYFNKKWLDFTGKSLEQESDYGWTKGVHPKDLQKVIKNYEKQFDKRKPFKMEFRLQRHDGEYRWLLSEANPKFDIDGGFTGYIGSCIDITERNIASERIQQSLKEKEILLKEIHHRVKNNLQTISSILSLQSLSINDETIKAVFKDTQSRIRSMALIHKSLYQSKDLASVDFSKYVHGLAESLLNSYNYENLKIELNVNIEKVPINIEQAIPCGLMINELLSNCFKYAFKDKTSGRVNIFMKHTASNYTMIVQDDGVGLPKDVNIENTDTMGLQLVTILTRQLGGKVDVDVNKGTKFTITFPKVK